MELKRFKKLFGLYWFLDHLKVNTTLGRLTVNSYRNVSLTSRGPGSLTQLYLLNSSLRWKWLAKTVIGPPPSLFLYPWQHWKWLSLQWGCHNFRHCYLRYHPGQVLTLTTIRACKRGEDSFLPISNWWLMRRPWAAKGLCFTRQINLSNGLCLGTRMKMSGLNVLTGSQG